MKTTFSKVLSCILALSLILSLGAITVSAENSAPAIQSEADIIAAINTIPEGSKGEITIENIIMGLAASIYVEGKDVTFNLKNAQLSAEDKPVIFGYNSNITINADEASSLTSHQSTGMMGTVRIDSGYDWIPETESFTGTNYLTVNGGKYFCADEDVCFLAASGTEVTLNNVICSGTVDTVAFEGVGITKPGTLIINSGKFTNDIREYAANGKFSCMVGQNYYVRDKEISDDFAKLVPNNTITFDCATPKSKDDASLHLLAETLSCEKPELYFDPESFTEDFKTCEIGINFGTAKEEIHAVEVIWNYDSKTSEMVNSIIEKLPKGEDMGGGMFMPYIFKVTDLELINYWVATNGQDDTVTMLINYSDEFKKYIDYKNFKLDTRYGANEIFATFAGGLADFRYNGTLYGATEVEVQADHILYVPSDTENTKDAVLAAAQKRLEEYVGKDKVILTYKGTVFEVLDNENFAGTGQHLSPDIDLEVETGVAGLVNDDFFFEATIGESTFNLAIKRDSSKMVTPVYKNIDIDTDVSVSTTDSSVPLDTLIEVEKLTEGEEYEKIVNALDENLCEVFDIKLHSGSTSQYITKLENGKFQVKIPVPANFEGKDLTVYYVDKDGNKEEHAVTVTNGFAAFETDHFSVYTLAAKTTAGSVGDTVAQPDTPKNDAPKNEIPKTGQSSAVYLFMITLVLGGLGIMASYRFAKAR